MTTGLTRALTVATYLLVTDGLAALWIGGILGGVGLSLVGAAVIASGWQERLRAPLDRVRGAETLPGLLAAVAALLDVMYLAESVFDGLVHLLLLLLLYRLYTRRSLRDVRDIGFLCFFMLVAAAPGTFDVGFLFVFVGFLVAGTWMLMLRHVVEMGGTTGMGGTIEAPPYPPALARAPGGARTHRWDPGRGSGLGSGTGTRIMGGTIEAAPDSPVLARAPGDPEPHILTVTGAGTIPPRRLLVLSVAGAVATLLITGALFFVIPRIGQATLPLRMKVTRMVSGFSERVSLGSFGEIETDAAVVMRVHVPDGIPAPDRLPGVRWRGIALDHFDGTAWTRDDQDRITVRRMPRGTIDVARARGTGLYFTQEIYLEPLGTPVLFAAPRILRLGIRADAVTIDAGGAVSVGSTAARRRYIVDSELETTLPQPVSGGRDVLDADARERYLQLPPLAPRVRSLAQQVAGAAPDPATAASRLATFLSERYRYTRVLDRQTSLPPVEEFLFVSRSGNCEYFAAALAVMLRALGIPARVVNGFQRGEWNPYGRYFMVRLLDAHSWVEAHVDGIGWFTLDPSPRGGQEAAAAPGPVNLYLDALRLRWYRYVVNWSLQDQVTAAGKVREAATTWTPSLGWIRRPGDVRGLAIGLAIVLVIGAGILLVRRRASGTDRRARVTHDPPRFYVRALKALARRGWRPDPAETAREFAARVAAEVPDAAQPLACLTGGYERSRFGEAALTGEELTELDEAVAALKSIR